MQYLLFKSAIPFDQQKSIPSHWNEFESVGCIEVKSVVLNVEALGSRYSCCKKNKIYYETINCSESTPYFIFTPYCILFIVTHLHVLYLQLEDWGSILLYLHMGLLNYSIQLSGFSLRDRAVVGFL